MQFFYSKRCHLFQVAKHLTITQCKRIEDATCYGSITFRNWLICLAAIILNSILHITWVGKFWSIRIYKAYKRRLSLSFCYYLRIFSWSLVAPFFAATLKKPHAADILQETRCAFYATFVGEVAFETCLVDDGVWSFDTHKTPSSAT